MSSLLEGKDFSLCEYRHFGFVEEYIWQVVDPRPLPLGTAIWIVDLGGMGLSDLGSEAFQFFKRMSVEVGMHYPERLYKYATLCMIRCLGHAWPTCTLKACLCMKAACWWQHMIWLPG